MRFLYYHRVKKKISQSVVTLLQSVKQGHVGVYFKYGALMDDLTQPGVHWMQPFVTEVVALRLTPETKTMGPMVCTTRDGVRNVFRDVQVHFLTYHGRKYYFDSAS